LKKNPNLIKTYDDIGKLEEAIETINDYNKIGISTKGENKTTQSVAFKYMCN
jgi:hypothetical protein